MSSRTDNAIKNSGASIVYKCSHILIRFAIRTVFIKLLGNEYTGISSLFTEVLSVLSLIEMGLDVSLIYSLYKPISTHDEARIRALMGFYRKAFIAIGTIVMLVGFGLLPFLDYIVKDVPNIKEDIRIIFLFYIFTSASSYFFVYKTVILKADQKARITTNVSTVVEIVECIAEIILLVVFKKFIFYLILHFLATIIRNLILSRIVDKKYPSYLKKAEQKLSRQELKQLLGNIGALCVYNMSAVVLSSTDSIFISAFVGTAQVAIVSNYTLITNNVKNIIKMVVDAVRPSVGNFVATGSVEMQRKLFSRSNFLVFWIACFFSTCLFTLLTPFIGDVWFNSSYKLDLPILILIVSIFYISVMSMTIGTFRSANGLFVQGWARPAVMVVINLALDYLLGKMWGIIGVYSATLISLLLTQVWYDPYIIFKHVFAEKPWSYYRDYLWQVALTALCCALVYWLSQMIGPMNKYLRFALQAFLAVIIPNGILFILFHRSEQFSYIKQLALQELKKLQK